MKDSLFDALSPARQADDVFPVVNRRNFVKFGAAGLGVLGAASSALATFPWRHSAPPVQQGPPLVPLPPPEVPLARLTFEVSAGVNPHQMLQLLQQYIAQTLTPNYAGQVVQAEAFQRVPTDFHQNYWSDFRFNGQIPPTRTRFGYYTGVNEFARSDSQISIRTYQDLNYFEMRRVINTTELNQFGMVLQPYSYRRPPTQADLESFYRVCRTYYGIGNPEAYSLLYVRPLTNGRNAFNSYLISRGPEPMRSPYKDLLIDNVPA